MKVIVITNSHRIDDVRLYGKLGNTISIKHQVTIIGFKGEVIENVNPLTVLLKGTDTFDDLWDLYRVTLSYNPDIVVCVEPLTLIVGNLLKRKTGCSIVYDCHEYFSEAYSERYQGILRLLTEKTYRAIENRLLSKTDLIISVNDQIRDRYSKLNIQSIVIPNYPVTHPFQASERQEKKYDIIYSGGISKERGVFKLLQATEKLKQFFPTIKTLIVGRIEHNLRMELQRSVLDKGLEENFLIQSEVPSCKVSELISHSKIGVSFLDPNVPRYKKAIPLKTLEYMAMGIPVVTNNFPYVCDYFQDLRENAEFIEYNTQSLINSIRKILSYNQTRLEEISDSYKKFVREKANWDLCKSSLMQSFSTLNPKYRILYCAYFYPPLGGPAVQRPCKTISILTDQGWECDVLTVKDIFYHSLDQSLLEECRERKTIRTSSFDLMYFLKKLKKSNPDSKSFYFNMPEKAKVGIKRYFPIDDKIGWLLPALLAGLKNSGNKRYRYVFATMGPYTTGLVGYFISKIRHTPLILDYRDHWTINPYDDNITILKLISIYWERKLLQHAQHVTVIGKVMKLQLMERFGEELEAKISVLYNGWDERDFQQPLSNSPKQGNVVTISYIGNFYRNRTPEYFVRAIEELKAKGLFPEGLKIKFVGNYFREARSALENNTLNRSLEIVPQVNHKEAVELMREASGLLLFIATPNGKGVLTGKLFEYLRVQKPILAMIPVDGEAADLLREHGHFNICPMEDKEAIKFTFAKFIREINDNSGVYRLPEEYTRKKQTLQFLHKLKESERQ